MKDIKEHFDALQDTEAQIEYIKAISSEEYERDEIISFLVDFLRRDIAAGLLSAALSKLVELNYCDKYLYSSFINSEEDGVRDIVNKGLTVSEERGLVIESELIELTGEGYSRYLIDRIKNFMRTPEDFREGILLGLLGAEDVRVRAAVLDNMDDEQNLNENILVHAVLSGSVVWFVRSAVAEILGRRKSSHLFDICEKLSEDKNVEVKLSTIKALSVFPVSQTEQYLRKFTEDRNLWVKKEAERALSGEEVSK